ncbi:hypothetical protein HUW62_35230, partial [Myxococcus sp. AM011]|nr:hypothetical protein [Myxococcus sp. AM011]
MTPLALALSLALLVGGLILFEYLAREDLGLDLLFFERTVLRMAPDLPGRPSPL